MYLLGNEETDRDNARSRFLPYPAPSPSLLTFASPHSPPAVLLFPKGYILDRIMEYRPAWKPRVMEWIEKNASCVVSVKQVRPSVHLLSFPFPSYTPPRPPTSRAGCRAVSRFVSFIHKVLYGKNHREDRHSHREKFRRRRIHERRMGDNRLHRVLLWRGR